MVPHFPRSALLACLFLTVSPPAAYAQSAAAPYGNVSVEYVHPEQFTDAGNYSVGEKMRAGQLEDLRKHLQRRAAHLLPAGQGLAVAITDVDLAGGYGSTVGRGRSAGNLRVVRDVYPPRINLRFRLIGADGATLREGVSKLRNSAFMMTTTMYRGDPLRFEKTLLDDWLDSEVLQPKG